MTSFRAVNMRDSTPAAPQKPPLKQPAAPKSSSGKRSAEEEPCDAAKNMPLEKKKKMKFRTSASSHQNRQSHSSKTCQIAMNDSPPLSSPSNTHLRLLISLPSALGVRHESKSTLPETPSKKKSGKHNGPCSPKASRNQERSRSIIVSTAGKNAQIQHQLGNPQASSQEGIRAGPLEHVLPTPVASLAASDDHRTSQLPCRQQPIREVKVVPSIEIRISPRRTGYTASSPIEPFLSDEQPNQRNYDNHFDKGEIKLS